MTRDDRILFGLLRELLAGESQVRNCLESVSDVAENMVGKGLKDGRCNRTACGNHRGIVWYNRGSRAYYCGNCAWEINRYNFGGEILCVDVTTLKPTYQVGQRVRILSQHGLPETFGTVIEDSPHIPLLVIKPDSNSGGFTFRYESVEALEK